ncbi:MAG: hypothetical protein II994_00510 [Lachnospiraceae bacterium]|nr:hypothetical protein [Lachnospiraceae bacterium]
MTAEAVISFVIYLLVAVVMIGIGVSQLRSKEPVAFYSGEKPPKASQLTDVQAWNRKHGTMWVIYGIVIMISYAVGAIIGDSIWCVIPMVGGVMIPVIIMIWYHHKLMKRYLK